MYARSSVFTTQNLPAVGTGWICSPQFWKSRRLPSEFCCSFTCSQFCNLIFRDEASGGTAFRGSSSFWTRKIVASRIWSYVINRWVRFLVKWASGHIPSYMFRTFSKRSRSKGSFMSVYLIAVLSRLSGIVPNTGVSQKMERRWSCFTCAELLHRNRENIYNMLHVPDNYRYIVGCRAFTRS